jgi:PAS domain S-box-containing protein
MVTLCLTAILLGAAVSERVEALRRAAGREAEQRTLLATAPDAVLLLGLDRRIRSANHAAERLFGRSVRVQSTELESLLPLITLGSDEGRTTIEGRQFDGETFPAEVSWARVEPPASPGYLVIVRDATERVRAESRLRERDAALARAMRFTMAGELASALAHELNQPITALVSYLQSAEILAEPLKSRDPRLHATLAKSKQEALRAADVLKRLRDFYRGGAGNHEMVNIGSLCTRVAEAFHDRLRKSRALLEVKLAPDLTVIRMDPMHLEIALHNLLGNALDAVSSELQSRRRIRLSVDSDGRVVTIGVEDSGPGVSAAGRRTLFEPFATSKPDGMGLGLAISRSLLRAQGGELSLVDGSILGGACFVIRLPLLRVSAVT